VMAEGADNQTAGGTKGFESMVLGTKFDTVDAYMQAKFADNDVLSKNDSIKKKRYILMEDYALNDNPSFKVDVILSFDRNDVFYKCDMEGPNRMSDPKLLSVDEGYFLEMLKRNYGESYRKETSGGRSYYRWSLGTTEIILMTITGKEFQFAKVSISDVALSHKQDDYEKAEKTSPGKPPVDLKKE
jgi:hypothetical protein